MVITSQVSLDFSENNLNLSSKNSTKLSSTVKNKTSKELTNTVDNSKSNNNISDKKEKFKEVLNSKKNSDENSNNITNKNIGNSKVNNKCKNTNNSEENNKCENINDSEKNGELEKLQDKLVKIGEEIEENFDNKKETNEIITSLLNTLNNLFGLNNNLNIKSETNNETTDISVEALESDSLKGLNQLIELLSSEKNKDSFDLKTFNSMNDILSNLHQQLSSESKDINEMKDGLSDILSKLIKITDDKNNNVLKLEDIIKKNYFKEQDNSNNEINEISSYRTETSKEEKVLNSLFSNDKDSSISSITQNVQEKNNIVTNLTLDKATFNQDLIKNINYMVTNNLNELKIKMDSGNLGEITIKSIQEDGVIKVSLDVNSNEISELLSQNLIQIKKELRDETKKISNVSIELYNDDNTISEHEELNEIKLEIGKNDLYKSIESLGNDSLKELNKLVESLNVEKTNGKFDLETFNDMKELLANLKGKLSNELKDFDKVKNVLNEINSKFTEITDNTNDIDNKILTLEEILKKSYSQNQNNSDSENNQMSSGKKETSKEDKFLSSLLDDNKDNSIDNKINLFSSKIQNIQGQNTSVRGVTVNKSTFTQDLIKDVKYMSTNNLNELTVKVNPGNLGEITIKLVQEDGLIKANLKANSKETTALLSQNLAEIKKELGDQSIKISEVNIELYKDDTSFFKDGGFGGALYQDQRRNNNDNSSTNNSKNSLKIQNNNEDVSENDAEIDTTLDFLA